MYKIIGYIIFFMIIGYYKAQSVYQPIQTLDTVYYYPSIQFIDKADQDRYNFLRKKVYKVWPIVLTVKEVYLITLEEKKRLASNKEINQFERQKQKELLEKWGEKIKDLSKTDGKVLIKLIARETGKTVYEILQESKSGWAAFWWQKKAKLIGHDTKSFLDPQTSRDDFFIEYIVQEGLRKGNLSLIPPENP